MRMQDSMWLEVFVEGSPQLVLEMVVLEDHIEVEAVLEVLAPPCVYTFIRVEIKTNTETVASGMFQKVFINIWIDEEKDIKTYIWV